MGDMISRAVVGRELEELRGALDQGSLQDVTAEIQQEMNLLENTTLHIAITGESGTGKSSLINALRRMGDYEEGSAEVGVKETTKQLQKYSHPNFPNISIWDLPGIGTDDFPEEEYLQKVNFSKYDFFIIVVGERFTAGYTKLTLEIQKVKKKFYYVRSKLDISIGSEKRKPHFSEEKTLKEIRNYCCDHLKAVGESSPRVFLISSWHLNMYDFPLLQETLEKELNDIKRLALILAMPILSRENLKKKKDAIEGLIWKFSLVSCGAGATPVPGLSLACNIAMLVKVLRHFCKAFGLDEDSLCRLANLVNKPLEVLRSAIKKSPKSSEITTTFVIKLLSSSVLCRSLTLLELVLDFVPVVSSLAGGALSFVTTFYLLKSFLKDVEEDAENVYAKAAER